MYIEICVEFCRALGWTLNIDQVATAAAATVATNLQLQPQTNCISFNLVSLRCVLFVYIRKLCTHAKIHSGQVSFKFDGIFDVLSK